MDFSETLQKRRERDDIFKAIKETSVNEEYYIQQKCPSKKWTDKEVQINKS